MSKTILPNKSEIIVPNASETIDQIVSNEIE